MAIRATAAPIAVSTAAALPIPGKLRRSIWTAAETTTKIDEKEVPKSPTGCHQKCIVEINEATASTKQYG